MGSKAHFSAIEIVFDENKLEYQSGDDVTGVVKFSTKGSSAVNIDILLTCVSEVQWVESPYTIYHNGGYLYYEKVRLVNQRYQLPEQYVNLSEGSYEIPFKFKLAERGIPSSFNGQFGNIKYYIEVINDDKEDQKDDKHKQSLGMYEFKVNAPFRDNLNLSIGCSKEKDFGILSFGSGKINLHASFSKKGWTPGELMELHVAVENQSTVEPTPRATLYQLQIFMCGQRHKALEIPLTEAIVGTKVEKHKNCNETLYIPIPKDLPLTIRSDLIRLKYIVHVTLDIPHAIDIHVNVPIVMTNVPVPDSKPLPTP